MTTADVLTFDEREHRYVLGDRDLVSVTTVLKEVGLIDVTWFTDEACLRGTYVHQAAHFLDEDDLSEDSVDARYAGYVHAYRRFLEAMRPAWSHIEHRVCDPIFGYAGTLDRAGTINGQRMLIDIKTGAHSTAGLQTAAYRRCLPEPHAYKRAALKLNADASFTLHELTDRRDEGRFLAALTVWQTKQELGR